MSGHFVFLLIVVDFFKVPIVGTIGSDEPVLVGLCTVLVVPTIGSDEPVLVGLCMTSFTNKASPGLMGSVIMRAI